MAPASGAGYAKRLPPASRSSETEPWGASRFRAERLAMTDRAFVFDIDNTLTPPREALEAPMAAALAQLNVPFALAAGSDAPLLMSQFFTPLHRFGFRGAFDAFVCNGASRYRCSCAQELEVDEVDGFSLSDHLGERSFATLRHLLEELLEDPQFELPRECGVLGERIVDRGSMINFAPIGRPKGELSEEGRALRKRFVAFDQLEGYRHRGLIRLRNEIAERLPDANLAISFGGQTSFDLVVRGRDKSFAVRSLLDEGYQHVTYFGDALFPGGNDVAVLEFVQSWAEGPCPVEVVQVDGPEQTHAALVRRGALAQGGPP